MKVWSALAGASLLAFTLAPPALAADDGFAGFWKLFTTALTADDKPALAKMVDLTDLRTSVSGFADFHAKDLGPRERKCLVKQKPVHGVDGYGKPTYSAFCGERGYAFSQRGGAWKLIDVGAND
ncbi:MAG TPA: hypothetical protein VGI95_11870 [Caulobacteraceae bacterium]|jgi:hypothetical protein